MSSPLNAEKSDRLPGSIVWIVGILSFLPIVAIAFGLDFGLSAGPTSEGIVGAPEFVETVYRSMTGALLHTVLESTAVSVAIITTLLAFTVYRMTGDVVTPVIGVALASAAAMDGMHILAADRLLTAAADNRQFIPFTWAISRLFSALILIAGAVFLLSPQLTVKRQGPRLIFMVSLLGGVVSFAVMWAMKASTSIPPTMYPDNLITRPWDVVPLTLFAFAGVFVFPRFHRRHPSVFSHAIVISAVPHVATQWLMAFGSVALYDGAFNAAHSLKVVAYLIPLLGLVADCLGSYRKQVAAVHHLEETKTLLATRSDRLAVSNRELDTERLKAEAALEAKSRFLASMSHEIRTPMTGVLGMAQLLRDTDLDKAQLEQVDIIMSSGNALLTIINDILDSSKIEAGKMDLETLDFDLRVAVSEVVSLLGPKAEEKGLELAVRIDPSVPHWLRGDPGRIRQILLNLVGNAIKFTAEGQVLIDVNAASVDEDRLTLRVSVTDTGVGLTEDDRQRLFEAFTQADASVPRSHGGTGLGLTICRQLAELMGGEIDVESTLGEGSSFHVTLELKRGEGAPRIPVKDTGILAEKKVLIVDDNEVSRRILLEQLSSWSVRATAVADADEALDSLGRAAATEDAFDLAIVDQLMPGADAFTLAGLIRARPALESVKLILQATHGQRGDGRAAKTAGFDAYLVKPSLPQVLRDVLFTLLDPSAASLDLVTRHTVAEGAAASPEVHSSGESKSRSKGRVLLAEDNQTNQIVAVAMLKTLGWTIDVAGNGQEAVSMWKQFPYDLILMDCQMPVMDGLEATREIRTREGVSGRIPIVAMTASAMESDRIACMEAGMNDFISKPVQVDQLARLLERWAGQGVEAASV